MKHRHINIGFDAKRAAQNKTGLGNYSRFVIRGLAQWGGDLRLFLFTPDARKTKALEGVDKLKNVEMRFPKKSPWIYLRSLWRTMGVTEDIKRKKIKLYHGLTGELPIGIHRTGAKAVVTIHDLIFMHFPKYYSFVDRWIYKWKFRSACRRANHIIAVSECTKRDIMHYFGTREEKISVIYQGCNEIFRKPMNPADLETVRNRYHLPQRFILYVGSIEERKNLRLLAEALALNPDEEIPVVAVGKRTKYSDKVLNYAEKHNIRKRFRILSGIPTTDLPAFYHLATLFVYPSRFEGFGIPLLEALCCGTPVIGCTGSCLEEAGGPGSLYVSPDDAQELSDAITRVLTDDVLRQQMIDEGLRYADKFTEEKLTQQLLLLYSKVLS